MFLSTSQAKGKSPIYLCSKWRSLTVFLIACFAAVLCAQTTSYTWNNVVTGGGGGYIPNIIFNPAQQNLVYVRTDMGGAYRWNPTTKSWTPLLDFVSAANWNDLGVESIATDPVDPTRLYIAVGTYTNSWTNANGAILRSTDQGKTFQRIALPFKNGGNMPGRSMGERLVVDPNLHSTLYFGSRLNGLWKSADYGVTWAQVAGFTAQPTYVEKSGDAYQGQTNGIGWVVIDPRSNSSGKGSQILYAGIADLSTSIYHSVDGGITWSALAGQPAGFIPQRAVLSSTGILYVTYSNGVGPYDGTSGDVWKYDTGQALWTRISPNPSTDTTNDFYGYGGLTVDAQHPNTVMVSALNAWWPDTIFFRSTDAGATWTRIWSWTSYPSRSLRYSMDASAAPWLNFGNASPVDPVPAVKLGWMVSGLQIDPFDSNHLLYGTGATLYGSSNLTNWDSSTTFGISVAAAGIEEMAVNGLISTPSGAELLSCAGDVNGFRHTDTTKAPSAMFTTPTNASCNSIDYAELSPTFVVRVGTPSSSSSIHSIGFSNDNGVSWSQGSTEPSGVTGSGIIAAASDASRVVWSDAGAGVLYSTNQGSSWTASSGLAAGALVASDRVNPKKFYGFTGGGVYVSTDGAVSFVSGGLSGTTPKNSLGTSINGNIKAVPGIEGDLWVAAGTAGLWHSTDSAVSFAQLSSVTEVDVVGFGKAATGKTYPAIYITGVVEGTAGFFRSDDEGESWVRINDDAHQYGATSQCITGDPRIYGRAYICTNGRGIVYGDIESSSTTSGFTLTPASSAVSVTQGTSSTDTISVTDVGSFTGNVTLSVSGLPTGVTASFGSNPTTGNSVLTLTASSAATAGTSTITITGTSGSTTATTTIALTISAASSNVGCHVTYTISNQWPGGFGATISLQNTSKTAWTSWALTWTFANGQTITQLWSGAETQNGANVTVSSLSSNGSVAAGATYGGLGFNGTWNNTTNAVPAAFAINGVTCN
jgi:hypothetical protein